MYKLSGKSYEVNRNYQAHGVIIYLAKDDEITGN